MFESDANTNEMLGSVGLDSIPTDGDILHQLSADQLSLSGSAEILELSAVASGSSDNIILPPEVTADYGETIEITDSDDPLTRTLTGDREAIAPLNLEAQSYKGSIKSSPGLTKNNGGWTNNNTYPRMSGDVNGDGRDDIIGFGSSKVFVALGKSDGTFGSAIASAPSPGYTTRAGGWTDNNNYPRMSGDINGDGRDDIIGFGSSKVFVSFGRENGTFGSSVSSTPSGGYTKNRGGWKDNNTYPRVLGDVNGDGKDDIIGFGSTNIVVSLSQGDGTFGNAIASKPSSTNGFTVNVGGWTNNNTYPRMMGDVNGDGEDDIVGFGSTNIFVSLSQGDGTFGDLIASRPSLQNGFTVNVGGWTDNNNYPRMLGDVNGDDKDDIIGFGSTSVFVSLSKGNGKFDPPVAYQPGLTKNKGGWTDNNNYPRVVGDVNGDDQDDLIGFGASDVFVSLSGTSVEIPVLPDAGVVSRVRVVEDSADDKLSFRRAPNTDADTIDRLDVGTSLTILEKVTGGQYSDAYDQWYRVQVNIDGQEREGYVAAYYIDVDYDGDQYPTLKS